MLAEIHKILLKQLDEGNSLNVVNNINNTFLFVVAVLLVCAMEYGSAQFPIFLQLLVNHVINSIS